MNYDALLHSGWALFIPLTIPGIWTRGKQLEIVLWDAPLLIICTNFKKKQWIKRENETITATATFTRFYPLTRRYLHRYRYPLSKPIDYRYHDRLKKIILKWSLQSCSWIPRANLMMIPWI